MGKYQYNISSVCGNATTYLQSYVDSVNRRRSGSASADKQEQELNAARQIFNYILDNNIRRVSDILPYVFDNGLYSFYRRSSGIFRDVIKENKEASDFASQLEDMRLDYAQSYELQSSIIDKQELVIEALRTELTKKALKYVKAYCDENNNIKIEYTKDYNPSDDLF